MLWISDEWKEYEVLDASGGERLERWGKFILVRPDPQVIWNTPKTAPQWKHYDARYVRANTGGGHWTDNKLPERWQIHYKDYLTCLLYTSPSPRDSSSSRMPSSA